MAISLVDTKILWGRAGGRCSAPGCGEDLTALASKGVYVVGEMAHVIGSKPAAARGIPEGGSDAYENLILLCPTHHTHIDKAPPGTYNVEMLHEWKRNHESAIASAGHVEKFGDFARLKKAVSRLLFSNQAIFEAFGPSSVAAEADPNSNAFLVWDLKRIDTIVPNNNKILRLIDMNADLIPDANTIIALEKFRAHAIAFETHVFHRLDNYPLFPTDFSRMFTNE